MKFINKYKSPNYDKRKNSQITFIIIHYTAISSLDQAIDYLCNPEKKVSTHYLLSQKGKIYCLVNEDKRAWHAGISTWKNYKDINSKSIGIELDYSFNKNNNKFSNKLIEALIILLKYLVKKYKIKNYNILGHSDIAPFRKIDPGRNFPWEKLYKNNLAFNPQKKLPNKITIKLIRLWLLKNKINTNKDIIIFILSFIGYDCLNAKNNSKQLKIILSSYKSHYLQKNTSNKIELNTINFMIKHFVHLVLTKKK